MTFRTDLPLPPVAPDWEERISGALRHCQRAFHGISRKGSDTPYFDHCYRVMATVARYYPDDPEAWIAALMHDYIEDIDPLGGQATLRGLYGNRVAETVTSLTNLPSPSGTRAARKRLDNERLAAAGSLCHSIKLADIIDNLCDISGLQESFAKIYLAEKAEQVRYLTDGHPVLLNVASELAREERVTALRPKH